MPERFHSERKAYIVTGWVELAKESVVGSSSQNEEE